MAKTKKEKKPKSKVRSILEWIATGLIAALIVFCAVVLFTTKAQRKNSSNPNAPAKIGNLYFPVLVLTNSMEPVYPVDSALFISEVSGESIYNEFINSYDPTLNDGQGEYKATIDLTFDDCYTNSLPEDEELYIITAFGKTNRTTLDVIMHTMTHRVFYVTVDESIEYGKGRYHFFVNGINTNGTSSAINQYQVFTEKQLYGRVTGCSKFIGGVFKFAESPWGLVILLVIPCLYMVISSVVDVIRAYNEEETEPNAQPIDSSKDPLANLSEEQKKKLKEEMLDNMMNGKDKKGKK